MIKPLKYMLKEEAILTTERPRTINWRKPNKTRMTLFRLNTAYVLEPHTAIRREKRAGKNKDTNVGRFDETRGKQSLLTDNGYPTKNTQDSTDSIPCIAAVDGNSGVKPTLGYTQKSNTSYVCCSVNDLVR